MKKSAKRILCATICIILIAVVWLIAQVMTVNRIHVVASHSTSDRAELHADKGYIAEMALRSSLVVKGIIVNAHTSVWASADQNEVAYPQGWSAVYVEPQAVLKGNWGTNMVVVSPAGWCPTPIRGNSFMKPFTNGQQFVFFLSNNKKLTRYCKARVFSHDELDLIPLN
jgi:hypothetical protein